MALILRKHRALTIFVQTCTVMIICCFARCTAGSCLSYGHTCWGAHGKRSDIQDTPTMHIVAANTLPNGNAKNGIAPLFKTQWILSRLITGQPILPLMDKYRVRWDRFSKDKSYVPPKLDYDTAPIIDEGIESRFPINENKHSERRISNTQGTMHNMNEKLENNREIFLISPGEYDKPINDPQKLNILKFLNEGNGDTK